MMKHSSYRATTLIVMTMLHLLMAGNRHSHVVVECYSLGLQSYQRTNPNKSTTTTTAASATTIANAASIMMDEQQTRRVWRPWVKKTKKHYRYHKMAGGSGRGNTQAGVDTTVTITHPQELQPPLEITNLRQKQYKSSSNTDAATDDYGIKKSEQIIRNFVQSSLTRTASMVDNDQVHSSSPPPFQVPGRKWHTLSILRELERLKEVCTTTCTKNSCCKKKQIQQYAIDYIINFNMKGWHRVEETLFPWMLQKVSEHAVVSYHSCSTHQHSFQINKDCPQNLITTFENLLTYHQQDIEELKSLSLELSESLSSKKIIAGSMIETSESTSNDDIILQTVEIITDKMIQRIQQILDREVNVIMPLVALVVPEKVQSQFNSQVVPILGIVDARIHLVHMQLAVPDQEQDLWNESIPPYVRQLLPRWKKQLYDPMVMMQM